MTSTETKIQNVSVALKYASRGWHVFPLHSAVLRTGAVECSCGRGLECSSPGKHPRTEQGLKDATTDVNQIRDWWARWPGANIGVATGAISGIVVLDVDKSTGGYESLSSIQDDNSEIGETVEAETGGGGLHLFFLHPGQTVKNSTSKVSPGLDVRGDGGYVVAAPSNHMSGGRYAWKVPPSELSPIAVPAWLLERMVSEPKVIPQPTAREWTRNDTASHWLGKALAATSLGKRNETGLWLACQLRDAGLSQSESESVLREYADRCPNGDKAYTHREAVQSVASAYQRSARSPAASGNGTQQSPPRPAPKPVAPPAGASAELRDHLNAIIDGRAYDAEWPWPKLTRLTNALIPGSVTVVCGDPGVGKTFFVLQCLRFWHGNGNKSAVFFVEKNRVFHTHRLLAQLESNGSFVDWHWIRANSLQVSEATARHATYLDDLGSFIHSSPAERVDLQSMLAWVREQCAHGARVIVIDPITAVGAGKDRWRDDEDFVIGAQAAVTAAGASLVLVTHSRKGNRFGSPTGHDMALGAAYSRFADSTVWLVKHHEPKKVMVRTIGGRYPQQLRVFFEIHKARNARGGGLQIGFEFGPDLLYAEQGVIDVDTEAV